MLMLNEADKLLLLVRLNEVILMESAEYFGSFGWKTKNTIAAKIPRIMIRISRRDMVQQRHFLKQLHLLLGGFEGEYGIARVRGGGYCLSGSPLSEREDPRATSGVANLRSAFDVLDADGDGKISHGDLRAFYGAETSGEGVIESMISVADSNKDGFVEYDEFEKVLESKKGNDRRIGVMEDAFRVMDKDGDGKVGHDDLKSYLNWAGFEADDEDVKAMIRLGGGDDQNGGVTFQGFLKVLAL